MKDERTMGEKEILLVYDRECPVCDFYCRAVRVQNSAGRLRIVDARESSGIMEEITDKGLDIDQGMVVKMDDVLYYGSDAIHALALISTRSGFFNRLSHWTFRSRARSRIFYPVLRSLRNLLLKLLGKTKIDNLGLENNVRF